MNEVAQELLKRADVIGAWLSGAVTKTADFATTQAIDIAMQYVLYGRMLYTFVVITSIVAFAVSLWFFFVKGVNNTPAIVHRPGRFDDGDWLASRVDATLIGGFGSVVSFIVCAANVKEFLMVWAAPKVWIMIQLAELAKGVK